MVPAARGEERDGLKAHPGKEPLGEAVVLGHGEKGLCYATAKDAEVGGAGNHAGSALRDALEDAVEGTLEQRLERALMTGALIGGDTVCLWVANELLVHGKKRLGLLLQVCVHDAHDLARGV